MSHSEWDNPSNLSQRVGDKIWKYYYHILIPGKFLQICQLWLLLFKNMNIEKELELIHSFYSDLQDKQLQI